MGKFKRIILVTVLTLFPAGVFSAEPPGWHVDISVYAGNDSNTLSLGGYVDKDDGYDNFEIPAWLGGRLRAYFNRPDWRGGPYFWSDWRSIKLPQEWTFYVVSNYSTVNMSFDVAYLASTVDAEFIDLSSGAAFNLRDTRSYAYTVSSTEPRGFMVRANGYIEGVKPKDTTPPETSITAAPAGYAVFSSTNIAYGGTDDISAALTYSYSVDGGAWSEWSSSTDTTITGLSDGRHTFSVRARDEAGNIDPTPAAVSFTVDTTPPQLTLNEPSPSVLWPPRRRMVDVRVTGSATDAGSGVSSVIYAVTDEYGEFSYAGDVAQSGGNFSFTVPLRAWRKGGDRDGRTYTIAVTAVDGVGNRSEAAATVTVPFSRKK